MGYPVGQGVRLKVVYRDEDGALVDPASVEVRHQAPDGMKSVLATTTGGLGIVLASYTFQESDIGENEFEAVSTAPDTARKIRITCSAL